MNGTTHRDDPIDGRVSSGYGGLFYGVYPALVRDIADPDGRGRVKVSLPWTPDPDSGGGYDGLGAHGDLRGRA